MKRIVNGVTYNTETSTLLAQYDWDNGEKDRGFDRLYQTRGGAFFIDEENTKSVWNEHNREHEEHVTHTFMPQSPEDAHKWLLTIDNLEIFHNPFDDPPEATAEAEPGATIYIRVPAALKKRVDDAARAAKASGNVWAMRCVERCLDPNPIAKKQIAKIYDLLLTIETRDDLKSDQINDLLGEAKEFLEWTWCDLGFDDPKEHPHLGTRITDHVDQIWRDRISSSLNKWEEQK